MNWTTMRAWLEQRRDLWIDVLRIYLGIGLFIRGLIFFTSGDQMMFHNFAGGEAYTMLSSGLIMHYVVLAHLCGGTLLAFGLLTRIAAAVQVPVLIGAVIVHAPDGVFALGQSLEFAAFVLVTLLFIIAAGPGRLSVDHYTFRRKITGHAGADAAHPTPAEQPH
jgi:uncharacterized membrane protein YphA (DoxX/SURF4 family)